MVIDRKKFYWILAFATVAGIACIRLSPTEWIVTILFTSFSLLILLSWLVIFESKLFNISTRWQLLFLNPFKLLGTIKTSKRLFLFWLNVAYLIGLFLGIFWTTNS